MSDEETDLQTLAEEVARRMLGRQSPMVEQGSSWEENTIITHANYFLAMLQRRGYKVTSTFVDANGWRCTCNIKDTHINSYYIREEFFMYETVATVAARLDLYLPPGQHHVMCGRCKESLLYDAQPRVAGNIVNGGYRAVKLGPASNFLSHCPRCKIALGPETVEEIYDG